MDDSLLADSRIHYLDNIRSIVIVGVVVFHSILAYVFVCPWWYVSDPPPIPHSFIFIAVMDVLIMPPLFLIAGLLARPSFARKGPRSFMAGKVKRLLVPFLLLTVLFSPIMPFIRQYLRAAGSGNVPEGFWSFWLSFMRSGTKIYASPVGASSDLVVNQYWFLMLLFIFFAGYALYNSMRGKNGGKTETHIPEKPVSRSTLLGKIAIFFLLVEAGWILACLLIEGTLWLTLGGLWQVQPAKIPIYLGFFLAGVYIERRDLLPAIVGITRPVVWFAVALVSIAAYLLIVLKTFGVPNVSMILILAVRMLRIIMLISVSLWLFTLFHNRFNRATTMWKELSANSYNIYLIHMVVVVVFQMLVLALPLPSIIKYGIVSVMTLLVCYLASRFIVRRSAAAAMIAVLLIFVFMSLTFK